jgi:TolA-binding protein
MCSRRRIFLLLILIFFPLLMLSRTSLAQEVSADNQQIESEEELFKKAAENVRLATTKGLIIDSELNAAQRAEQQLKKILELYPNTSLRNQIEDDLSQVQEILGLQDLQFANFYLNRGHGMKGAESRLQKIIKEYPNFSRMDEVLLLLGKAYLIDERAEDAANYFWKLVCRFPTSKYTNKAFEQIYKIGFDASQGCDNASLK